jgi:hypothetical protein
MKKLVLILSILGLMCGCGGGGGHSTPPAISVSLAPANQTTIDQGQTLNFTATVANDSSSKGVTWSVSGAGCSGSACGTFTNAAALTATYNAPTPVSSNLTVSVLATSVADTSKSASSSVVVTPPPTITTTSLLNGTVGTAYSATLHATGGAGTLTWSLATGSSLPANLSLNSSSGAITGTPTASGPSTFTVKVTDSSGGQPGPVSATQQLSITINNVALGITTTSLPTGLVGTAYSASVVAAGGTAPYTFSITGGSLPTWATLNPNTGAITGMPTAAGTSPFTVSVTDSSTPTPQTVPQPLSITIYSVLAVTTTSLPNGSVNAAYSASVAATGGTLPYTFSITGSLPAGLSLNSSSGAITGTPTTAGTSTFTVSVADSSSPQQTTRQQLSITINGASGGALTITTTTLPTGAASTSYSGTVQVSGGTPPYTWSITVGSLPTWATLNPNTGAITGTPTATGTSNFTVTVTDSSTPTHQTVTQSLSITVNAAAACTDSGSESLLSGQYAFSLSGFNATGFLAVVGSITVDGSGHITAGEADTNGTLGPLTSAVNTSASSYSVGSNHLGCATIVTTFGTFNTRLSLGSIASSVATEGRMIEWETGASAYIAAGHILQQTASDFSSGVSSNYAFEESGVDPVHRLGGVGVISVSGGSVTSGELDMNDAGTLINKDTVVTGTYTSPDTNGRFTMTATWTSLGPSHQVFYMVSSSQVLFLSTDPQVLAGEGTQQSVPAGGFTNGSLNGTTVFYMTGLNGSGSGGEADIGLANGNGSGSLAVTDYGDDAGTWSTPNPLTFTCTYAVASNGRMTLSGGSGCTNAPVFYLTAANTAFMLDEGSGVEIGQVVPQTGGPFSAASLSGTSYMGDLEVANQAQNTGVGVLTLNGSGGYSMTSDYTATYGQQADQTQTGTIGTVNSNGTFSTKNNGVIDGIMISSTKFVAVDNESKAYPTILVGKQ